MSDSFLDRLPSQEREKIRKRLRSPEAYEALRDKVKGPEDLQEEMQRNEKLAELHFSLESDPHMRDSLKTMIAEDVRQRTLEDVLDTQYLSAAGREAIEQGKFDVTVEAHPATHEDALVVLPEGVIHEKVPVHLSFSERYVGQMLRAA